MQLPLISYASSIFKEDDLKDCYIIGLQHILPSTHTMIKSFFDLGLKKENFSLIGKSYSTDYDTYKTMIDNQIDLCPSSLLFNSHQPYDEVLISNIRSFLKERKHIFSNKKYKKIIVLDDGGELLNLLEEFIEEDNKVVAIEQTSSGYNKLKNKNLKFPVVNMARSWAKINTEYEKIVDESLEKIFNFVSQEDLSVKDILILGNGSMGASLYKKLGAEYEVTRIDINKEVSDLDENKFNTAISKADLIIGCSGEISLPQHKHKHLKKDVILVSISSSDREFDAIHLRKQCSMYSSPWNNLKSNDIHLLNSGFPINFNNFETDDVNFFQFIRSLIMSSIYQAINTSNVKGFVDLDHSLQEKMVTRFNEYRLNKV